MIDIAGKPEEIKRWLRLLPTYEHPLWGEIRDIIQLAMLCEEALVVPTNDNLFRVPLMLPTLREKIVYLMILIGVEPTLLDKWNRRMAVLEGEITKKYERFGLMLRTKLIFSKSSMRSVFLSSLGRLCRIYLDYMYNLLKTLLTYPESLVTVGFETPPSIAPVKAREERGEEEFEKEIKKEIEESQQYEELLAIYDKLSRVAEMKGTNELTIDEIKETLGMAKTSLYRLIAKLIEKGFLKRAGKGKYALTA